MKLDEITVLAVDDDLYMRELEKKLLEKLGVKEVLLADSAQAALNCVEETDGNIDVILLDLNMPFRSGLTFLKKLREHESESAADIPVIIVSAEDSSSVEEQLDELDISGYVNKPINPDLLEAEILEVL